MRIVLDAGHGMKTAGKRCMKKIDPNETREWYLNQRIVSKVQNKLKDYDVEVLRVDDPTGATDIALNKRTKDSNNFKADLYCSFHHNAGVNGGSGGGLVVITYDERPEAVKMRKMLYDCLISAGAIKGNRSQPLTANKNLAVLRDTNCLAILAEHGFMDSTTDVPIILSEQYAEKMANGWIAFFEQYLGIKKKSKPTPQPTPQPKPTPAPQPTQSGYKVKITVPALNIRSAAGTDSKVVGCIKDMGIYTIVEDKMVGSYKWGRLKSGAGWISLAYTKKV